MKKRLFLLIPALALLAGCGKINLSFSEGKNLTEAHHKGALGDFALQTPADGAIVNGEPTFSWTESENAIYYNLEVCSTNTFDRTSSSIVYTQETNISSTSFKLSPNIAISSSNSFFVSGLLRIFPIFAFAA